MLRLALLALVLAPAAASQDVRLTLEAGGSNAGVTLGAEWTVAGPLAVRAGVGTFPAGGIRLAIPVGLRVSMDAGPVEVEVGAGGVLTRLSSQFLYTWVTDTPDPSSTQVFPSTELMVRVPTGRGSFVRAGGAALYDRYHPYQRVVLLPSVGVGMGL